MHSARAGELGAGLVLPRTPCNRPPVASRLPPPHVRARRAQLGGMARAVRLWTGRTDLPSLDALERCPLPFGATLRALRVHGMCARYVATLRAARIALATRGDYFPGDGWRCGARTRAGGECQAPPVIGRRRCRMHGGASTGPRTVEGRARARANLRRG